MNVGVPVSPGSVVKGNVLTLDVPLRDLPGLTSGPFRWGAATSVDAEFADELPGLNPHMGEDRSLARFPGKSSNEHG